MLDNNFWGFTWEIIFFLSFVHQKIYFSFLFFVWLLALFLYFLKYCFQDSNIYSVDLFFRFFWPQIFNGVFLKVNKATVNMLHRVEPYVTYGYTKFQNYQSSKLYQSSLLRSTASYYMLLYFRYPNLKSVKELIYKRGYGKVDRQRIALTDNSIIEQVCLWFGFTSITKSCNQQSEPLDLDEMALHYDFVFWTQFDKVATWVVWSLIQQSRLWLSYVWFLD
jgi:hypothetical protein